MTLHSPVPQSGRAASASSGGPLAIETRSLSKHFGPRKAVDGLTISVPQEVIAGFVGPNGAAKTTTIRLLLGLVRPTGGSPTILVQPIPHPRTYPPPSRPPPPPPPS